MTQALETLGAALEGGYAPDPAAFTSNAHRRLARALADRGTPRGPGPRELAVLVRHVLRHEAEQHDSDPILALPRGTGWPSADLLEGAGLRILRESPTQFVVQADPWHPAWLAGADAKSPEADAFAEAARRNYDAVAGDPFMAIVQRDRYRSVGQREAVRAILASPPDATLAVNLPTGAGKSLCAHLPALMGAKGHGVTVVVVPTTALAMDQDRAVYPLVGYPTAYYSDSSAAGQARRAEIRQRIRDGEQAIVFTSPEGLVGSLASALYQAVERGLMRYMVIDEAHLIDQWGDAFRPHFQVIPGLRRDLLRLGQFRTLLLTATMTEGCLDNLELLFGGPGPFQLISACQLRPEPCYWFARCETPDEKYARLLDALDHLPRPLIVYGSEVDDVVVLAANLRRAGFRRLSHMTGDSTSAERLELLDSWRAGDLDIVVATSAFGLGVDQDDVRAVLHVCVPETIDRYYQEVGRGGRDGKASLALMLYTEADWSLAGNLNDTKLLTVDRGLKRWSGLFHTAESLEGNRLRINLNARANGEDKYLDMKGIRHRAWNANLLNLMARARLIEMDFERPPAQADFGEDDAAFQAAMQVHEHQRVIRILDDEGISTRAVWEDRFEAQRQVRFDQDERSLSAMREALRATRCLSAILTEVYGIRPREVPTRRPPVIVAQACGGCPHCRRIGEAPFACEMPHPSPVWPIAPGTVGSELAARLGRDNLLMIYYEPGGRDRWEQRRARLLRWLVGQGVRNVVMPEAWRSAVAKEIGRAQDPPVFCYDRFDPLWMSPVPTVVLHPEGAALDWADVTPAADDPPVIHLLPATTPDPSRPDRPLREVLDRGRAYAFEPLCLELSL